MSRLASGATARTTSLSKLRSAEHLLGRRVMDRNVETQLADDRLHGLGLLGHRVAKFDRQIGPENRQHHARHSAAGADVEHAVAGIEKLFEGLAVDDVAADEFFVGGVPRQIELLVPVPQQPAIAVERVDLVGGQVDARCRAKAAARVSLSGAGVSLKGLLILLRAYPKTASEKGTVRLCRKVVFLVYC